MGSLFKLFVQFLPTFEAGMTEFTILIQYE